MAQILTLALVLVGLNAFLFAPQFIQSLKQWKAKRGSKDFSSMVFFGFVNLLFLSPAYWLLMKMGLRLYDQYRSCYSEIVIIFILGVLTFRVLLPRLAQEGSKIQIRTIYFFFSLLCLSLIYVVLMHSHLQGLFDAG